jgi:triphosphoribosyl-dephospho-CoA synthase
MMPPNELIDGYALGVEVRPPIPLMHIADAAVGALRTAALLAPLRPGLVDGRGAGHPDAVASAEALREPLRQCAEAARTLPLGPGLRDRLGAIGRAGERRIADVTRGVSTHRGALWTLGLLSAGTAVTEGAESAASFAALVARTLHPCAPRRGTRGAVGEARGGFPHVIRIGLPALRASRRRGETGDTVALNALLAIMATLDDTGVVRRGGADALRLVNRRAADVVQAGGCATVEGRGRLESLCRDADHHGLAMGGSADLLAATLFLDRLAGCE